MPPSPDNVHETSHWNVEVLKILHDDKINKKYITCRLKWRRGAHMDILTTHVLLSTFPHSSDVRDVLCQVQIFQTVLLSPLSLIQNLQIFDFFMKTFVAYISYSKGTG